MSKYSYGVAAQRYAWPVDDPQVAHERARLMSTGSKPWAVHEYPSGGGPGKLVATYRNGEILKGDGSGA